MFLYKGFMKVFNNACALILSSNKSKFLCCINKFTPHIILPGWVIEKNENPKKCAIREIKEELNSNLIESSMKFINKYEDLASGYDNTKIKIFLFYWLIDKYPKAWSEIVDLIWIWRNNFKNPRLSNIIKNKIIPDIISQGLLV